MNSLFPLPLHPFNLNNVGIMTYTEWQYKKGYETLKFYLENVSIEEMFKGKTVLDIGCGGGGKTIYYASQGAELVYGLEILAKYEKDANDFAAKKNLSDKFKFVCSDAANTKFDDNSFDTIIMNDAMEHVDKPLDVLNECYRILKPGGRLYLNFPPYNHPYGAHLSDVIGFPWVHVFFSDKTMIQTYKDLVSDLPDGKDRIEFRISKDKSGNDYFSYINKMTIRRFSKILVNSKFKAVSIRHIPLRNIFSVFKSIPVINEFTVKMVVCILEKN
jgi:ubiquinone/menaquinone biosynthesis C-methylase UbiE